MTKLKTWFLGLPLPKQVFFGAVALIIVAASIQALIGMF